MCGIVGLSGKNEKLLAEMLESIKHRGPDGEGRYIDENFSLGMRRLAIIDPKSGNQPIWSKDKNVCIFCNGEIYNYRELWEELTKLGHKFSTDHSDTETILQGYLEWGTNVVNKLRGMYAFVIYDLKKGELFIARDRLGIKPFYYYSDEKKFVFGSEIKAILKDKSVLRAVDNEVLYQFLMYRVHDAGENTFFKGIKRLLPGHLMIVDKNGQIKKNEKYWQPKFNPNFKSVKSDDDYAHEFYDLFKSTISHHILSDVPVGVTLSGGLDSSGVVSVMKELTDEGADLHAKGKLFTFSALYPGQTIDESNYIHEVEKRSGSQPVYTYPKVDEFDTDLPSWVQTQEEPTISSAPYAYWRVYKIASEHVKVSLSGNGGDELLAGYIPYFNSYLHSATDGGHYWSALREVVEGFDLYRSYIWDRLTSHGKNSLTMKPVLTDEFAKSGNKFDYQPSRNLNERLFNDVTKYSTPNLLRYEDKNSMAFSIEARVPFLDHQLVEYIFNLPIDQKIKHGWNRYIYRNAMKGHMSELNRRRRSKIGFTNPEVGWLKLRQEKIITIFESEQMKNHGIFQAEVLTDKFRQWCGGNGSGDPLIFWRALITELWMESYLDD